MARWRLLPPPPAVRTRSGGRKRETAGQWGRGLPTESDHGGGARKKRRRSLVRKQKVLEVYPPWPPARPAPGESIDFSRGVRVRGVRCPAEFLSRQTCHASSGRRARSKALVRKPLLGESRNDPPSPSRPCAARDPDAHVGIARLASPLMTGTDRAPAAASARAHGPECEGGGGSRDSGQKHTEDDGITTLPNTICPPPIEQYRQVGLRVR